MHPTLRILRDYFPTAVYTGSALVFISETYRVELTEHEKGGFSDSKPLPLIRVRLFTMQTDGDYSPGHYEDFQLPEISDLAAEIEKFIQAAIGSNIKEIN